MKIRQAPFFMQESFKETVKAKFQSMKSVEDLADLLNYVYRNAVRPPQGGTGMKLFNPRKVIHVDARILMYYGHFLKTGGGYHTFQIMKKSGGIREIAAPKYTLKVIQRCLVEILYCLYEDHKAANGFVPGRSIASNAKNHFGKRYVLNIDIKDFFPSTRFGRIRKVLTFRPFNLQEDRLPIATLVASLCCRNGALPQGAPTSPVISNIVCRQMDARLADIARKYKAYYSRYADDLTFSANADVFNEEFKRQVTEILSAQGYDINQEKYRLQDWKQRQEVTGLVVNKKVNVERQYIKDVRYWLHVWQKFGMVAAQTDFLKKFLKKKGFLRYNGKTVPLANYLRGKLLFLNMIRGKEDKLFEKLNATFESLLGSKEYPQKVRELEHSLHQMFEIWERGGIEEAKAFYQRNIITNGR